MATSDDEQLNKKRYSIGKVSNSDQWVEMKLGVDEKDTAVVSVIQGCSFIKQ